MPVFTTFESIPNEPESGRDLQRFKSAVSVEHESEAVFLLNGEWGTYES